MMRRNLFVITVLVLISVLPFSARADKDFIQKIQNKLEIVQEKGRGIQEKIQEAKDKFKSASEGALKTVGDIKTSVQDGNPAALKDFGKRVEGLPTSADTGKDEMAEAVNEKYVATNGEGNDDENFEKAKEYMQELLRNASSKLYALAFTTRTKMQKEKPRDVDMNDTIQMKNEVNLKSIEMIERLAQIYILESAMKEYQYTLSLKNVTIDQSQEDEEK